MAITRFDSLDRSKSEIIRLFSEYERDPSVGYEKISQELSNYLNQWRDLYSQHKADTVAKQALIEHLEGLKQIIKDKKVEVLCLVKAKYIDGEIDQTMRDKKNRFHKKGLVLEVLASDELEYKSSNTIMSLMSDVMSRVTIVGHWSPGYLQGLGPEEDGALVDPYMPAEIADQTPTTNMLKISRFLSEKCANEKAYPLLKRFTLLGCRTAVLPADKLVDTAESKPPVSLYVHICKPNKIPNLTSIKVDRPCYMYLQSGDKIHLYHLTSDKGKEVTLIKSWQSESIASSPTQSATKDVSMLWAKVKHKEYPYMGEVHEEIYLHSKGAHLFKTGSGVEASLHYDAAKKRFEQGLLTSSGHDRYKLMTPHMHGLFSDLQSALEKPTKDPSLLAEVCEKLVSRGVEVKAYLVGVTTRLGHVEPARNDAKGDGLSVTVRGRKVE